MAIEDYYNTSFVLKSRFESKVNGRNVMSWTEFGIYVCAIFTPSTEKTVRFGKQDFIVSKNLYCDAQNPIKLGDIVDIDGAGFDVVSITNTNNLDHHLAVGLYSHGD